MYHAVIIDDEKWVVKSFGKPLRQSLAIMVVKTWILRE